MCWVHIADATVDGLRPYSWYRRFLVEGARAHHLPEDYIATLETIDALDDPNSGRERRRRAIECGLQPDSALTTRRSADVDTRVAREILSVVGAERRRRQDLLTDADAEYAYDQWRFEDLPFINELCLTLLVVLWHQIERELVHRAARVTADGKPLEWREYLGNIHRKRRLLSRHGVARLGAELAVDLPDWIETLRLLANCYKHDPMTRPSEALLNHLKLPSKPKERLVVA